MEVVLLPGPPNSTFAVEFRSLESEHILFCFLLKSGMWMPALSQIVAMLDLQPSCSVQAF